VSSVPELTDAQQRVIERLYEGKYAAAIADELDVTRQAVSKHVKNLEEKGLITEHPGETAFYRRSLGQGTSVKIYGLTDAGIEALRKAQGLGPGETPRTPSQGLTEPPPGQGDPINEPPVHNAPPERGPRVEVHNFEVKIPVEGDQAKLWLPETAELNNWTRRWDENFHGVFLEATSQHLLLRAGAEANSVEVAEGLVLRKLVKAIELLEDQYGLELGTPEFRCTYEPGKAKVGVTEHPLAEDRGYDEGELATIDDTPEPDTIHPTDDPADADRIVQMARRAERTEDLLEGLVEQQTRFFAQLSDLLDSGEGTEPSDHDPGMEVQ